MPEFWHTQLDGSVRDALVRASLEILPGQIRQDALTQWILSFDDIRRRERDNPQTADMSQDDPRRFLESEFLLKLLQAQLPFYYVSLFHIGRIWKISARTVDA